MPSWPGSRIASRSSAATLVSGPALNLPVDTAPGVDMWLIWMPVSDDPTPSMTIRPGLMSMRRCLAVGVSRRSAVGDDRERRYVRGTALDGIGDRPCHGVADDLTARIFSRSIVRTTSSASNLPCVVGNTTVCPVVSAVNGPLRGAVHEWREGEDLGTGILRHPLGDLVVGGGDLAGVHVPATERRHEDVVLAPQHALRHPGGAPGVEHVEVVGRRLDRRRLRRPDETIDS